MKYRKKPVEIEAFRWTGDLDNISFPDWITDAIQKRIISFDNYPYRCLYIKTLEGTHRADPGDYIIKGVKGELYPCKPDIFDMTYDEVQPSESSVFEWTGEAMPPSEPIWLGKAIEAGVVKYDYPFLFMKKGELVQVASPGDRVVCEDGKISFWKKSHKEAQ